MCEAAGEKCWQKRKGNIYAARGELHAICVDASSTILHFPLSDYNTVLRTEMYFLHASSTTAGSGLLHLLDFFPGATVGRGGGKIFQSDPLKSGHLNQPE